MRAMKRRSCSSIPTPFEPQLDQDYAAVDDVLLGVWTERQETFVFRELAETHNILHAGAIVPTAVKDHYFAGCGKMLHVTLHEQLGLFPVRWRWKSYNTKNPRADALSDRLDGAALPERMLSRSSKRRTPPSLGPSSKAIQLPKMTRRNRLKAKAK